MSGLNSLKNWLAVKGLFISLFWDRTGIIIDVFNLKLLRKSLPQTQGEIWSVDIWPDFVYGTKFIWHMHIDYWLLKRFTEEDVFDFWFVQSEIKCQVNLYFTWKCKTKAFHLIWTASLLFPWTCGLWIRCKISHLIQWRSSFIKNAIFDF